MSSIAADIAIVGSGIGGATLAAGAGHGVIGIGARPVPPRHRSFGMRSSGPAIMESRLPQSAFIAFAASVSGSSSCGHRPSNASYQPVRPVVHWKSFSSVWQSSRKSPRA